MLSVRSLAWSAFRFGGLRYCEADAGQFVAVFRSPASAIRFAWRWQGRLCAFPGLGQYRVAVAVPGLAVRGFGVRARARGVRALGDLAAFLVASSRWQVERPDRFIVSYSHPT